MYNYRANNVEQNSGVFFKVPFGMSHPFKISARAEEVDPSGSAPGNEPHTVNFEEAIALARKEEKDKLYPQLKKLKEDTQALTQSLNESLLREAQLKKAIEELKEKDDGSSRIKELEDELEKAQKENKQLLESSPKEEDIRAKVEKEYEAKYYRDSQITANRDSILAIFDGEIIGATNEEVDESIAKAKQKTLDTYKAMGMVDDKGNIIKPSTTTPSTTTPAPQPPVANPSAEEETFDAEYVKNLDPRSQEYAEWRKKMGLK